MRRAVNIVLSAVFVVFVTAVFSLWFVMGWQATAPGHAMSSIKVPWLSMIVCGYIAVLLLLAKLKWDL